VKTNYLSIAYFLISNSTKTTKNQFANVKVIAGQSSDIFLRHSVDIEYV